MDLSALKSKIGTIAPSIKRLATAEVAEALIATWAIEFLRLRRVGGFRPVEVLTISLLMVIIRTIIKEAGKRGNDGRHIVVSDWDSPMESMGRQRDFFDKRRWRGSRRTGRYPY